MKLLNFQKIIKEKKLDFAFLTGDDPNIIYFTQMKPSFGHFLVDKKEARLFLTKLDDSPKDKKIIVEFIQKNKDIFSAGQKISRIGLNKENIHLNHFEKLKQKYPKTEFVDISQDLNNLRKDKTAEEISYIKKACSITSTAFDKLVSNFADLKLRTEKDVAFFLEKEFADQDAEIAFPTIVASGKNSSIPHHVTTNQKLLPGFLQLDFGARYKNYCADMSRVLYLGRPKKEDIYFYDLLKETQQTALDSIKEGISFEELMKISRNRLGKYSSYFIHSLGHGVGVEVHEAPRFSDKSSKVEKNTIFTIEPGIYFPGKFGLRIEDMLLFDGKVKILTKANKELIKI